MEITYLLNASLKDEYKFYTENYHELQSKILRILGGFNGLNDDLIDVDLVQNDVWDMIRFETDLANVSHNNTELIYSNNFHFQINFFNLIN